MVKNNFQLKLEIVNAYMQGDGGFKYLTKEYNNSNPSMVKRWVNAYREFGESGFIMTKKLYLHPFMDFYNSEIVSYSISKTPNAKSIMYILL